MPRVDRDLLPSMGSAARAPPQPIPRESWRGRHGKPRSSGMRRRARRGAGRAAPGGRRRRACGAWPGSGVRAVVGERPSRRATAVVVQAGQQQHEHVGLARGEAGGVDRVTGGRCAKRAGRDAVSRRRRRRSRAGGARPAAPATRRRSRRRAARGRTRAPALAARHRAAPGSAVWLVSATKTAAGASPAPRRRAPSARRNAERGAPPAHRRRARIWLDTSAKPRAPGADRGRVQRRAARRRRGAGASMMTVARRGETRPAARRSGPPAPLGRVGVGPSVVRPGQPVRTAQCAGQASALSGRGGHDTWRWPRRRARPQTVMTFAETRGWAPPRETLRIASPSPPDRLEPPATSALIAACVGTRGWPVIVARPA